MKQCSRGFRRALSAALALSLCLSDAGAAWYGRDIQRQENGNYVISIDTEDHTFLLRVSGSGDTQEWDRFLNK